MQVEGRAIAADPAGEGDEDASGHETVERRSGDVGDRNVAEREHGQADERDAIEPGHRGRGIVVTAPVEIWFDTHMILRECPTDSAQRVAKMEIPGIKKP